jgi:Haem-binding domain
MNGWRVCLGVGLVLLVVALQFVPTTRTNPPEREPSAAPPAVHAILVRSCYDCHSNETRWPWYSRLAPASFLIAHDVVEGRRQLNLSTWNQYDARRKRRKLREISEQVQQGKMPQWYYLLLHPDARLSVEDRQLLVDWAGEAAVADEVRDGKNVARMIDATAEKLESATQSRAAPGAKNGR